MKEITIYGKKLPMRMTMGAMLRFKRMTGKDVEEIGSDVALLVTFMYCCVASACNADNVEFGMDLDKFADGMSVEDMNGFAETLTAAPDEKKSQAEA